MILNEPRAHAHLLIRLPRLHILLLRLAEKRVHRHRCRALAVLQPERKPESRLALLVRRVEDDLLILPDAERRLGNVRHEHLQRHQRLAHAHHGAPDRVEELLLHILLLLQLVHQRRQRRHAPRHRHHTVVRPIVLRQHLLLADGAHLVALSPQLVHHRREDGSVIPRQVRRVLQSSSDT